METPAPRRNEDGSFRTFAAFDRETGDPVIADDRTFDESKHSLVWPLDDGASPKEKRTAELEALSAAGVKEIAEKHQIEHKNKADSIAAILAKEFGE